MSHTSHAVLCHCNTFATFKNQLVVRLLMCALCCHRGASLKDVVLHQVMTDEEGLQGCCFAGTIVKLQIGFALVKYEHLMDEADTDQHLQEWFPLPEAQQANIAELGSQYGINTGPGVQIRPQPSVKVSLICCTTAELARTRLEHCNAADINRLCSRTSLNCHQLCKVAYTYQRRQRDK